MGPELVVDDLRVRFRTRSETVDAVDGASFTVEPGAIVGLVGESGSGKSVTARSIVRLESPGEIVDGSIKFDGRELTSADDRTLRRLRGRELAMVFQDPSTTLNPVYTVGEQIAEAIRIRENPGRQPFLAELAAGVSSRLRTRRRRSEVLELMETVGIPQADERIDAYPHQFSGGMCQRVALAMALARRPSLLIADEPTTALDTTTQAAILDRLARLNAERGMGILLISHDLGVVSELCDRVVVMYDGTVVEYGPAESVRSDPEHPYTKALLDCLPHRSEPRSRLPTADWPPADDRPSRSDEPPLQGTVLETDRTAVDGGTTATGERGSPRRDAETAAPGSDRRVDGPIVELEDVAASFRQSDALVDRLLGRDERVPAVNGVSLSLRAGETVGLVGESGCGKSTLVRLTAGLEETTAGEIRLRGERIGDADSRTDDQLADVGVVFQNPTTSLNPKRTVGQTIAEPLFEAGWDESRREDRIEEVLSLVDLPAAYAGRYPRQLSGGQCQRVAIARALALEPSVVLLDEPTAALDVSTQARILNLLADLQADLDLAYLFVSHDLAVVRHIADRVAVMYLGQFVEVGPTNRVLSAPTHPYTQTLLDAIPGNEAEECRQWDREALAGEPPSPTSPPDGCAFHPRCPVASEDCTRVEPPLEAVDGGRTRCLYAGEWRSDDSQRSAGDADATETQLITNSERTEPGVARTGRDGR
ncbi:dipeptide ABC transporter ATP-binding protein [Natrialba swarupiae]|uniref:ABC transporter ATP-binding protein n=1 Tax=Natrialba swarupiae TaxID=2448032 RepID=A0A5D5AI60_9EURY|nr:ABC transporter ATP-binding protein [Natrialba swarupiae]TYT61479.1 ABC transporter ATP-binding protein [Natrialba swarupiae]